MSNVLVAIILGIVQGIAEWLPISSKTQELLASHYVLNLDVAIAYTFGLFMEMGSIGTALVYFRREVLRVFKDFFLLKFLIIVTVFTGIVGVPLYLISDKLLQNAYNPSIPMIILGVVLILDGIYIKFSRSKQREFKELTVKDMIIVGIAQGLAALPGVSRSGMTVSTMLLLGVKPEDAFKYSYLAYIPAAIGAVGTTILLTKSNVKYAVNDIGVVGIVISILIAFLTGLIVIHYLLKFAKSNKVYVVNFSLGAIAITVSALGLILA
ncbi:MAG: undecaprenyl-diphosphate phosphatase [Sulfolobaceae archaeon]